MRKLTLAIGDVVQIRNMDGFKPRTISRFSGRCCVVEEIYCGRSDFNALIRIKGAEPDDEFQSITVLVSRLVKIDQLPKGTKPEDVQKVKPALASQFGPVPVDEWSYNSTTFSELVFGEVARVIGESPAFPYVRKADTATWFYVSNQVRHVVRGWGISVGADGWCCVQNAGRNFNTHFRWVNMIDFTFITAFEYPAMRAHTERAFSNRLTAGH